MKRIFLLAVAALMFAACSSDNKEDKSTLPDDTKIQTQTQVETQPAKIPDTSAITPPRPMNANPTTASSKEAKTEYKKTGVTIIKGKASVENAAGSMGYAPTIKDSNTYIVNKENEDAFLRKKIHENNSIDGGGQ